MAKEHRWEIGRKSGVEKGEDTPAPTPNGMDLGKLVFSSDLAFMA